jgi:osmotically-inducible protein OsmY
MNRENRQVLQCRLPRTCFAALLAALISWTTATVAVESTAPAVTPLQTVVVTAKKLAVPDEVLLKQVATALHDDPYFPDMHVVVTISNGVVHLTGFVYDADDMAAARRIIKRRVVGVKRVVNELEISMGGSD